MFIYPSMLALAAIALTQIFRLSPNHWARYALILVFVLFISRGVGISMSALVVFIYLVRQVAPKINEVVKAHQIWIVNRPYIQIVIDQIEKFRSKKTVDGAVIIDNLESVKLQQVSFEYNRSSSVLTDLSLEIPKNRMTALVGLSGAGKSTIADLIIGLIDPTLGKVLINGLSISEINKRRLHAMTAYVSQESVLFNGTIKENITIRRPEALEKEIGRVLQIVALEDFISSLPDGLDTQVGENGVKLSGGQKQRIALARALIIEPQLLILDEATSALDVESEAAIQSALEYMRNSLTIIVIAHRLSTVKSADMIFVIEKGSLVEQGSYDELVERRGRLFQFDQIASRAGEGANQ